MDRGEPILQFPVPSALTLALLAAGILLFFSGAAWIEWNRRRAKAQRRGAREWDAARDLLRTKGVEAPDAALLEDWVRRFAATQPLRAVTTREGFDALVVQGMERARKDDAKKQRRDAAATLVEDLGVRLRTIRAALGLIHVPAGSSLTSTRELSEGQWMSIANGDIDPPRWFRVMIEDVNEAHLYVAYKDGPPSSAPKIPVGAPVRCSVWRADDARYTFTSEALAYDESPALWRLKHTDKLHRTQARAHYRIRHDQEIVAGVLSAPQGTADSADLAARPVITRLPGRITSLSAGGCAIVFRQSVTRHVLLRFTLDLPAELPLEVQTEIVSTAHISGGRFLVRSRFLGLSEDARDRIARYVHHKQQQRHSTPPAGKGPIP